MKKFLSMVMAAAMVVSLVPATAFAASDDIKATAKVVDAANFAEGEISTDNRVDKGDAEPELQLTLTTADTIKKGADVEFTLTLDNAKFDASKRPTIYVKDDRMTAELSYAAYENDLKDESLKKLTSSDGLDGFKAAITLEDKDDLDEIKVRLTADELYRGTVVSIRLGGLTMDKVSKGKTATISVDSSDMTVTNGDDLVFAAVESKGIKASVKKAVDVATEEMVKMEKVKVQTTVGNFKFGAKDELKLKLNSGFEFALGTEDAYIGDLKITKDMIDEDEIVFDKADIDAMGITGDTVEITNLYVEAVSAKAGATATMRVYLTGCDTVSVEVAKVVDYVVSMTVDEDEDVPVMYSGVDVDNTGITDDSDHEALEVTIKETFAGAWNNSKDFTLSVPEGVYIADVKATMNGDSDVTAEKGGYDSKEQAWFADAYNEGDFVNLEFKRRTWTETNPQDKTDVAELTFTLKLVADPNFEGDVVLKLEGDAVDAQEVTIAKFVKPYVVEAQQNDLQIDYRNTEIPTSVVIKEAEAGLWDKGTTFVLSLDKIGFDDEGKVAVDSKSGLEIKDNEVKLVKAGTELSGEKLSADSIYFTVDSRSDDEPAVVTISGMQLYMQRSLPAGAYDLDVMAVGDKKDEPKFNAAYSDQLVLGGDKTNKIDDTTNRYIKDINDDFVSYTAKAGFVNIVTAGREDTESFTTKVVVPVGESYLISGENKVEIDVPAYINANGYTMLPLRAVAVALGINSNNVLWDQTSRTATVMYGSKIINMTYGQKVVYVNGAMIPATAAVEITNDRMFLGLRDLGNALGVTDITWDAATKTATLNGNK